MVTPYEIEMMVVDYTKEGRLICLSFKLSTTACQSTRDHEGYNRSEVSGEE